MNNQVLNQVTLQERKGRNLKYDQLIYRYEDSTDSEKVKILWNALGQMQYYNGYTYNDCIVLAQGGTIDDINEYVLRENQ